MTDVTALARPLRIVWAAVCVGGALAMGVFGWLGASAAEPALAAHAQTVFYGVAVLSMAATAGAFALLRAMEARLLAADSDADAAATVRTFGIASLAAAEVPALASAVAMFLTGDPFALALGLTLFAFAWLTWPSDGRVGYWLALRRRG